MATTTNQRSQTVTFFNTTLRIAAIAIVLIIGGKTAAQASTSTSTRTCGTGVYGLAGDWGLGSLLARTPHNIGVIHSRYGYGLKAYRIIHNITPPRCG